jgi:WD40 repeat protein
MFVVSYGALDFDAAHTETHAHGALAFYSMRSRAPLRVARFDRGVMTVDWCADSPTLLALGCYDGEIIVVDVREFGCAAGESSMHARSYVRPRVSDTRHAAPAWSARWTRAERGATVDCDDGKLSRAVVSTSTDGKVMRWDVARDALHGVDVLSVDWSPPGGAGKTLNSRDDLSSGGRDAARRRGGATCLDFSKDETCYIIGTQEGNIHKCSLGYVNEYLATYSAHVGPVYCVSWSPFHPHVFATCSADGKVKIFMDCTSEDNSFMAGDETSSRINSAPIKPAFVIEHSQRPINSLDWSPWCSTEFAIVTDDGALEIWNLASSVAIPKTVVQVTSDHTPGTVVSYARDAPVIIVGCACGSVSLFRINWQIRDDVHAKSEQQRRLENLFKSSRVA